MISRRNGGFTLIELLVVIAIIAVLAAILFPVFITAKDKAKQSSCLSNQRQMYSGLMLYANDNDQALPVAYAIRSGYATMEEYTKTYSYSIKKYLRSWQVMSCPARPTQEFYRWDGRCGYALTTEVANVGDGTHANGPRACKLAELVDTKMILLQDGIVLPPKYLGDWQTTWFGLTDVEWSPDEWASILNNKGRNRKYTQYITPRHKGAVNCTSVDGHSRPIRSGEFLPSMFTKARD